MITNTDIAEYIAACRSASCLEVAVALLDCDDRPSESWQLEQVIEKCRRVLEIADKLKAAL